MSDDNWGRDYDDMVVAFDYLMHALVKVEALRAKQFRALLGRVEVSGLSDDDAQLLTTYLCAMRGDNIN